MSIIALDAVPLKWTMGQVMKSFAKIIPGRFEGLNFDTKKHKSTKTCYIRLSEKLDPLQVIEKINRFCKYKRQLMKAYIPEDIPDLPLERLSTKKTKPVVKDASSFSGTERPERVFITTHTEIMRELQTKYTGLYYLSKKSGHKLLQKLAEVIFARLKIIVERNPAAIEGPCQLSKAYRKVHPHFADFQCILSNLHQIEDETGKLRTQVVETDLMAVSTSPYVIDNVPYNKIVEACTKYSERINNVFNEHMKSFDINVRPKSDSEEEIARKTVRAELAKLGLHMPTIIKQVISKHLTPGRSAVHIISIYGEPTLPLKGLRSFVSRHKAVRAARSKRVHNLLRVEILTNNYGSLMTMDGTIIGGSKLIIRRADVELHKIPESLIAEMKAVFGVDHVNDNGRDHDPGHMDVDEDWIKLPIDGNAQ